MYGVYLKENGALCNSTQVIMDGGIISVPAVFHNKQSAFNWLKDGCFIDRERDQSPKELLEKYSWARKRWKNHRANYDIVKVKMMIEKVG